MLLNRSSLLAYAGIPPVWAEFRFNNPPVLPAGSIRERAIAFSPSSDAIAMAHANSPFLSVYQFSAAGFGNRYANAAGGVFTSTSTGGTNVQVVRFSPSGNHILFAEGPNVHVIEWSSATGFGSRFTYVNPGEIIAATIRTAEWSTDGQFIFVGNSSNSKIGALPFTGNGFGSLVVPSSPSNSGTPYALAVHPSGYGVVMTGTASSIAVQYYPWSGSFGNLVQLVPVFSGSPIDGVAFSPAGTELSYMRSGYRNFNWAPGVLGSQIGETFGAFFVSGSIVYNQVGNLLSLDSSVGPQIFSFISGRIKDMLRTPDVFQLPALRSTRAFSPNGAYFAYASTATPFIHAYKVATL